MKKSNLVLVLFLVFVISLSLFVVACNDKPSETTAGTTAESTEPSGTDGTSEPNQSETGSGTSDNGGDADTVPEAGSTLTIKQVLALAQLLENDQYTEGKYYITGTIKNVFNKKQGNVVISDSDGNVLKLYSLYNEDGTVKYADMAEKPVAGDTVKVYGVIGFVNGAMQVKDGWIIQFGEATTETTGNSAGNETTEAPQGGVTTEAPQGGATTEAPQGGETTEALQDGETTEGSGNPDVKPPSGEDATYPETEIENGVAYPFDPDVQTEKNEEETTPVSSSCHKRYEWNDGYHWTPACDRTDGMHKNPIKKGKESTHNLYCTVEDEGDVVVYTYTCKTCGYTPSQMEVSYNANLYIDPATLAEATHDFGEHAVAMVTVDGFAATRFISTNGSGSKVIAYEDSSNTLPTGKYMVIRIKPNSGRSQFRVAISSVQSYADHMWLEDCVYATVGGIGSGWSTVIIDASKLVEETEKNETVDRLGYTVASDGNYYLCSAQIYVDGMEAEDYFDLGYIAFCDTLEQAYEVSEGDNVKFYYADLMASEKPTSSVGTVCDHNYQITTTHHSSEKCNVCFDDGGEVTHKYTLGMEKNSEGKIVRYGVSCVCGHKTSDKIISEDINAFTAPTEMLVNNWWHGYTHGNAYVEGEDIYQRIYLTGDKGNHKGSTVAITSGGDIENYVKTSGGSGNYFVFKIRTHDVGVLCLKLASKKTEGETKTIPDGYPNQHQWTQYNDQWMTIVVDLNGIKSINGAPAYDVNDAETQYITAGFQYIGVGAWEDTYIDVAYFAVCDTLEEVKKITQQSVVNYTVWANTSPMNSINLDTGKITCENGSCTPSIEASADRKTYKTVCSMCKNVLETKIFTQDINYYSVPGQFYNNWNTGGLVGTGAPTGKIMNEDGVLFSRITLQAGGSMILGNGTADYVRKDGWNTSYTVYGGTGQYLVFKLRGVGNTELGLILDDDTKATFDAGSRPRRSAADISDNTWRVYVVDIAALNYAYYGANSSSVTTIMPGFMGAGTAAPSGQDRYIDLAYYAICDNWAEIAEVTRGEQKVYLTDWVGTSTLVESSPDGQCIGSHSTPKFDMSDGVAKYVCALCGTAMKTIETPTDANFYSAAGQQWNIWASGGLSGEKTTTGSLVMENGVIYNRITMKNGGSFEFVNVAEPSDKDASTAENVITGGSGRYIVFRIKFVSDASDNLALILYDGQTAGYVQDTHRLWAGLGNGDDKNVATGEWVTYVIDMEMTGYSWYTENNENVNKASFGLNVGTVNGYSGDRYIDVQYFAVCDNWTEVAAVVGSGTVKYTKWSDTSINKILNCDGSEITQ